MRETRSPDSLYTSGITHYKNKSWGQAIECFERAIRLNPNNPDYLYSCGLAKYELHQWAAAIGDFERAIRLNPNNPDYLYSCGLAKYELHQWAAAIGNFEQAIRLNPFNIKDIINSCDQARSRLGHSSPAPARQKVQEYKNKVSFAQSSRMAAPQEEVLPKKEVALKQEPVEKTKKGVGQKEVSGKMKGEDINREIDTFKNFLRNFNLSEYQNYENFQKEVTDARNYNIAEGTKKALFNTIKKEHAPPSEKNKFFGSSSSFFSTAGKETFAPEREVRGKKQGEDINRETENFKKFLKFFNLGQFENYEVFKKAVPDERYFEIEEDTKKSLFNAEKALFNAELDINSIGVVTVEENDSDDDSSLFFRKQK